MSRLMPQYQLLIQMGKPKTVQDILELSAAQDCESAIGPGHQQKYLCRIDKIGIFTCFAITSKNCRYKWSESGMTVVDTKSLKLDYFLIFIPPIRCTRIEPFWHGGRVALWATWPTDVHLDSSDPIRQGAPNRLVEQLNIKTVFNFTISL